MEKKTVRRILAIILIIILVLTTVHVVNNIKVNKTIKNFTEAAHTMDVRSMLAEVNSTFSVPLLMVINLSGVKDTSDFLEQIFSFIGADSLQTTAEDFFSSIEIQPRLFSHFYSLLHKECTVRVKILYGTAGVRNEMNAKIKCIKRDGNWYISGLK